MTGVYDTEQYARSRLLNTIVMYKRKPVKVLDINKGMKATVVTPINGKLRKRFIVDCADLNIFNLTLGFVNKHGRAKFLARRTLRHDWRQGLRPNNVSGENGDGVSEDEIGRALLHRYPDFDKALATVKERARSCAWCEDLAVDSHLRIVWRYEVIGEFVDGAIKLKHKFEFLSTYIKESINGRYEVF